MKTYIGFIGLGIMGLPMAMNLIKNGHSLKVYDVDEHRVKEAEQSGAVGSTLSDIAASCRIIFLCVPNGSIVKEVVLGEKGLVGDLQPQTIVIDTSSITPNESQYVASQLEKHGAAFLDAPVSGGEPGAINGTLAFMVGGSQEAFDRAMPYLESMGKSFIRVGDSGSGSTTKLVNQIIVNLNIAVLSEGLVFAKKAGADPALVYKAIRGGLAGSAVMDSKAPMILARDFAPGGKISINHKDIGNVLQTAHANDIPIPLSAQLFEIMQTLKVRGLLDNDHGAIVKYFESLADVVVE